MRKRREASYRQEKRSCKEEEEGEEERRGSIARSNPKCRLALFPDL